MSLSHGTAVLSIQHFKSLGFDIYVIVDNIEQQLESAEVMDVDHQAPLGGNTDTGGVHG
jgi:hypothetical protein